MIENPNKRNKQTREWQSEQRRGHNTANSEAKQNTQHYTNKSLFVVKQWFDSNRCKIALCQSQKATSEIAREVAKLIPADNSQRNKKKEKRGEQETKGNNIEIYHFWKFSRSRPTRASDKLLLKSFWFLECKAFASNIKKTDRNSCVYQKGPEQQEEKRSRDEKKRREKNCCIV